MQNEQANRFDTNGDDLESIRRAQSRYQLVHLLSKKKKEGLIQAQKANASE